MLRQRVVAAAVSGGATEGVDTVQVLDDDQQSEVEKQLEESMLSKSRRNAALAMGIWAAWAVM